MRLCQRRRGLTTGQIVAACAVTLLHGFGAGDVLRCDGVLGPPQAVAVVLVMADDAPSVAGYLQETSAERVVVLVPQANGDLVRKTFDRSELFLVLDSIDESRLAGLDPADPEAYRDYAEELAVKRRDPEARDLAVRLFLIAAAEAPQRLGRSCLLGATRAARTRSEARRFRAIAYLFDPEHDRSVLKTPGDVESSSTEATAIPAGASLLKGLRLLRQGEPLLAERILSASSIETAMESFDHLMTYGELRQAVETATTDPLAPELLARVLQLELELVGGVADESLEEARRGEDESPGASWSEIVQAGHDPPMPRMSLSTITEFDPARSVFRNGRWVRPEGASE